MVLFQPDKSFQRIFIRPDSYFSGPCRRARSVTVTVTFIFQYTFSIRMVQFLLELLQKTGGIAPIHLYMMEL